MNRIGSHSLVDKGVTFGDCRKYPIITTSATGWKNCHGDNRVPMFVLATTVTAS